MNNQFIYCFFKYIHSLRLGESLNVGLLLIFPDENRVIFKCPDDLQRLKCTYNDFEEDQLKVYLKGFENKAIELSYNYSFSRKALDEIEFIEFIKEEFIAEDEGALQFSQIRKAVKYVDDIEQIVDDLFFTYFEHYYHKEELISSKS